MLRGPATRRLGWTVCLALGVWLAAGEARADEEQEEEQEAPKKKKKKLVAPEVGAPPDEVEAYLRKLEDRRRKLKERQKAARRSGDEEQEAALSEKLADADALYKSERDRLTERDVGMIAGGATLVGLGAASFAASLVALIGWGVSAIDGYPDDEWGWASLGCLGGGVLGISVGVPLIVIGSKREPRSPEYAGGLPAPGAGFVPGVTLSWSF